MDKQEEIKPGTSSNEEEQSLNKPLVSELFITKIVPTINNIIEEHAEGYDRIHNIKLIYIKRSSYKRNVFAFRFDERYKTTHEYLNIIVKYFKTDELNNIVWLVIFGYHDNLVENTIYNTSIKFEKKYVEYQEITHIQPCKVVDEFIEGDRF